MDRKDPVEYINKVTLGNTPRILNYIPDDFITLTLTSPPFYDDELYLLDRGVKEFGWKSYSDYLQHLEETMIEIYRITKPGGRCILVLSNSPRIIKDEIVEYWPCIHDTIQLSTGIGWKLADEAVWIRKSPNYNDLSSAKKPDISLIPYHDWISVLQKPSSEHKSNRIQAKISSVWEFSIDEGPMQEYNSSYGSFPDAFIEKCLSLWSLNKDVILDPYAGSGQTIRVAIKEGRRAIGFEADKKWESLWADI